MQPHPGLERLVPEALPAPVRELLAQLHKEGFAASLVGGCVRDLLRGVPVADFDVASSAPPEAVLALFPRAIPTGLRHGTVTVPTRAGPVDVTRFRAGPNLEDDLARRDFTLNAIAWDPVAGRVIDPWNGAADLAAGRLRAVGSPAARLDEDPLRAVRAARLVATLDLAVDPSLRAALREARGRIAAVAPERIRRELEALLRAPGVARGLALLRESGIEAALAPGAAPDAPAIVAALPNERALRLAAWLRGADAGPILQRLRFPRRTVARVDRLLRLHPIERAVDPGQPASVRRLLRRADEPDVEALFALREVELSLHPAEEETPAARERLDALRAAIRHVRASGNLALRRRDLALGGREVMEILGRGPGPHVGAALRYLTEQVIEDPSRNTPAGLGALLETWRGGDRA